MCLRLYDRMFERLKTRLKSGASAIIKQEGIWFKWLSDNFLKISGVGSPEHLPLWEHSLSAWGRAGGLLWLEPEEQRKVKFSPFGETAPCGAWAKLEWRSRVLPLLSLGLLSWHFYWTCKHLSCWPPVFVLGKWLTSSLKNPLRTQEGHGKQVL